MVHNIQPSNQAQDCIHSSGSPDLDIWASKSYHCIALCESHILTWSILFMAACYLL